MPSLPHLSLVIAHRRGWGSAYAVLARGDLDAEALCTALAAQCLVEDLPVYALDVSVWPRCDAEASPDRGYYYHPSRHSASQPIVAGWAYQWLAQLSFIRDSWTAPLEVRRVHPLENANTVTVEQIHALLRRPPVSDAVPLFVFDAGYDSAHLGQGLAKIAAAILVRLRSGRCVYGDPPPPGPTGRPPRYGARFDCQAPTTWPPPTAEHTTEDEQYGQVRVRAWAGLRPKIQNHTGRGTRRPRPIVRGTVVRVEVTRLPGRAQPPQVLWRWWQGPGTPDLDLLWRAYVRRFDLEHPLRFVKQSRAWTTPRGRHPEQADRWTWGLLAAYTQLRLARPWVADRRLPWERRLPAAQLTPYRVWRVVSTLLLALGTPARAPKPCGRSPGRPKGRRSGHAPRHAALKKTA